MIPSRQLKQGAFAFFALAMTLAAFRVVELGVTPRFDFQFALDRAIPFVPATIFLYQSLFFYVIAVSALLDAEEFSNALRQVGVAVAVGFACFALFPAAVSRPEASQIAEPFVRQRFVQLWWLDDAHNTFPSLHVAITWIVTWAFRQHRGARLAFVIAAGISVSTLTVKQHAVVDVVGGAALAAVALALAPGRRVRDARDGANPALDHTHLESARSFGALVADWGLIALSFAAAVRFQSWPVYLLAGVVIARTQLALAVLMHESAHGLLFRSRTANDVVGQLFTAAPLALSLPAYRYGHLKHHRAPMVHDDPVAVVFQIADYPISRRRLALRLLLDLTGVSYFISIGRFVRGDYRALFAGARSRAGERALVFISIPCVIGSMWGLLAILGHPWLYLGLWTLPSLTLLQVMGRIRAIMEHAGYRPSGDQARNARTIVRPSWQTFFFGPHAVHFHIEHHVHVRVPFYRLREVHDEMAARGLLPAENLYRGYGRILREVTSGTRPPSPAGL